MSDASGEAPATATDARRDRVEFVRVRLGEAPCTLELERVERLVADPETTRVPGAPPAVAGVAAVGSDVAPVVEGRTVLGLAPRPADRAPTLLVLDREGDARTAGLLADEVVGIDTYHVDRITPVADWEGRDPAVDRRWLRAVVDPAGGDPPVGVLALRSVLEAAADGSAVPNSP